MSVVIALISFGSGFAIMWFGLELSAPWQKNPQKATAGGFLFAVGIAVMVGGAWFLGR